MEQAPNYRLFFDFLQTAIGVRTAWDRPLTDGEWSWLYEQCTRQALLGIGLAGAERLYGHGVCCPKALNAQWIAEEMHIRQQNEMLNTLCKAFSEEFEKAGFRSCLLKGQSNMLNYPETLKMRRQSGDIDIWVKPTPELRKKLGAKAGDDVKIVTDYLVSHGAKKEKIRYHHLDMSVYNGVTLEVHFRPIFLPSPWRNKRLQKWFNERYDECAANKTSMGFSMPTPSVNVIYQLFHLFVHFQGGNGVGLRQMLDLYYAVIRWHKKGARPSTTEFTQTGGGARPSMLESAQAGGKAPMSAAELMGHLHYLGISQFAEAAMWLLHEVYGLEYDCMPCKPNRRKGQLLLNDIMQAGNFGKFDNRGSRLKDSGTAGMILWKLWRIARSVTSYPEDALCEPFFRLWHWVWRRRHGRM